MCVHHVLAVRRKKKPNGNTFSELSYMTIASLWLYGAATCRSFLAEVLPRGDVWGMGRLGEVEGVSV